MRPRRLLASWIVAAIAGLVAAAPAGASLYWGNAYSDTVGVAALDGTGARQDLVSTAGHPYGVAVDSAHLYWTNGSTIGRANRDGSGVDQQFITGAHVAVSVAVDGQHVYWANGSTNTIGRANLDGTGVDQSFISGTDGVAGLAVDGQHIYWGNAGGATIGRANLDGTGVDQAFLAVPPGGISGVAVDGQHIYWADGQSVGRANLDGSGAEPAFVAAAGTVFGVAVDSTHLYWTNFAANTPSGGTIGRASLDGSGVDQRFVTGAHGPTGITVDAAPSGGGGGGSCPNDISLGQVVAHGCFAASGGHRFAATGPVRVNGIDFTPRGAGQVSVDTAARTLHMTGDGTIGVGGAAVSGWRGDTTFALDQVPLRIDSGAGTALIGATRYYGFALGSELDITFGPEQSSTLNGVIDLSALGDGVTASLKITANNEKGLVSAQATVGRGADFGHAGQLCKATATPPLGFECAGPFTNAVGRQHFQLIPSDGQVLRILGRIPVENVTLTYLSAGHEWDLEGTIALAQIFGRGLPSLILGAGFQTDPLNFNYFKAGVTDIQWPVPLVPESAVTKLSLAVRLRPKLQVTGAIGLEAGTEVGGRRPVGIDGDLGLELGGDGFKIDVHGTVNVLDQIQLAQGYVTVSTSQGKWNIAFGGNVGYSIGPASLDARVNGSIALPHFQLIGDGTASVFGQGVSAHAVLSDAGIGACGTVHIAFYSGDVGFKYLWGHDGQPTFDGCDFSGLYTVSGSAATARAAAPGLPIRLPSSLAREEITVTGNTGPPDVTLSGPRGTALPTPPVPDRIVSAPGGLALAATSAHTTYFVLAHPAGGVWRVTPITGSPAVVRVARADPLKPARVRVHVLGRGSVRTLVWRLVAQRGQTVTFEQPSERRPIATTGRARGRVRFTVAPGPGGVRRVRAVVAIDGFPRRFLVVGRFRAAPLPASRVVRLRAVLRRSRLAIRWGAAGPADLYQITVILNGASMRFVLPGRRHALFATLPVRARVRVVRVVAVAGGVTGPVSVARPR